MKNTKFGFTLLELLVVIAIIGLLATIAIAALDNARTKARDAGRVANLKQYITAIELFNSINGIYPAGTKILGNPNAPASNAATCLGGTGFAFVGACATPILMGFIPEDASDPGDADTCFAPAGATPCHVLYQFQTPTTYVLKFFLEKANDTMAEGFNKINQDGFINQAF